MLAYWYIYVHCRMFIFNSDGDIQCPNCKRRTYHKNQLRLWICWGRYYLDSKSHYKIYYFIIFNWINICSCWTRWRSIFQSILVKLWNIADRCIIDRDVHDNVLQLFELPAIRVLRSSWRPLCAVARPLLGARGRRWREADQHVHQTHWQRVLHCIRAGWCRHIQRGCDSGVRSVGDATRLGDWSWHICIWLSLLKFKNIDSILIYLRKIFIYFYFKIIYLKYTI